ncbi:golgin subfamily A member 6-like protein 24 [Battus philenor]|uniref:golgin subfamily A member 6-like protein 24 n=1 Tax=Battus philenor TaxID=42288 RepID=UPI0035CEE321
MEEEHDDVSMQDTKENKHADAMQKLMSQARRRKIKESYLNAKEVFLGEPDLDLEWHAAPYLKKCYCPVEPCICQSHLLKAGNLPQKPCSRRGLPEKIPTTNLVPRLAAAVKADIEITKQLEKKLEERGAEFCASNCRAFLHPVKEGGYHAERKKLIEKYIKDNRLEKKMRHFMKVKEDIRSGKISSTPQLYLLNVDKKEEEKEINKVESKLVCANEGVNDVCVNEEGKDVCSKEEEKVVHTSEEEKVVHAQEEEKVHAHGEEKVPAHEEEKVHAHGEETVHAHGEETVPAHEEAKVPAHEEEKVHAHEEEKVHAHEGEKVHAHEEEKVHAHEEEKVHAHEEEKVHAHEEDKVHAHEEDKVHAHEEEKVHAHGEEKVVHTNGEEKNVPIHEEQKHVHIPVHENQEGEEYKTGYPPSLDESPDGQVIRIKINPCLCNEPDPQDIIEEINYPYEPKPKKEKAGTVPHTDTYTKLPQKAHEGEGKDVHLLDETKGVVKPEHTDLDHKEMELKHETSQQEHDKKTPTTDQQVNVLDKSYAPRIETYVKIPTKDGEMKVDYEKNSCLCKGRECRPRCKHRKQPCKFNKDGPIGRQYYSLI